MEISFLLKTAWPLAIATANVLKNGQPDVVFIQPVTIKSEDEQAFTGLLTPIDTSIISPQQKVRLMVNFINQNPVQAKANATRGVQISYYVGSNVHPVIKGFGETQAGIYDLAIPSKLLSQGNNVLHVRLWYDDKGGSYWNGQSAGLHRSGKKSLPFVK
jgi:hypothetical protein